MEGKYLIYSVEDDVDISNLIKIALSKQGYEISCLHNGDHLFKALEVQKPDMILLDIMLPGISGIEILKKLRDNNEYDDVHIIIISAKNKVIDKIGGFDLGADDYIEKPFNVLELISRVHAKFRRASKNKVIAIGDISLDIEKHLCIKGEERINLTNKEFDILILLLQAKGNVVSREEVLNKIWDVDAIIETRTVDMHIKSLRQKLHDRDNNLITTVHGLGYKINV